MKSAFAAQKEKGFSEWTETLRETFSGDTDGAQV